MSFRPSAFSFTRTTDPGVPGGDSLLSDMFSPNIPESLPSYPSGRRSGRFSFSNGLNSGNKIQHLPPPPSPGMASSQLPTAKRGFNNYGYNNESSYYGSGNYSSSMDIPSSPAAHLYSTPPTSRKPVRGFRSDIGMHRERLDEEDEDGFRDVGFIGSGSPPPLCTFYDGPLGGGLSLSLEDAREEEEERYASISSYRRDAGFKDIGMADSGILDSRLGESVFNGPLVGNSRKRTWASTLDDDEWYENGRGGAVKRSDATNGNTVGGEQGDGLAERGQGGGGKRRIIDVVGSVASRLWEVVKDNASWGLYYPSLIVKGVGGGGSPKEELPKDREDLGEVISRESIDVLAIGTQDHQGYSSTSGYMAHNGSTMSLPGTTLEHMQLHQNTRPHSSSSRRSTLTVPNTPTKNRRRSNSSFVRGSKKTTATSPSISSTLNEIDTESGLRASWVLVPQQEFAPSAPASTSDAGFSSRSLTTRSTTATTTTRPPVHARSASAFSVGLGKRRPFRYPVKPAATTGNVIFEFGTGHSPGGGAGRRCRKKSLSGGGIGGWTWGGLAHEEKTVFREEVEEDEVDESMRRWNERLRAMIKEGKEALGSTVEVMYED